MKLLKLLGFLVLSIATLYAQNEQAVIPFSEGVLLNNSIPTGTEISHRTVELNFEKAQKKSVGKALLLSLLLPGAGELYAGNQTHAKIFFGTELLVWTTFLLNDHHANSLKKDYQSYARLNAGVSEQSHSNQYWIDIGKFDDIYAYNNRRANDRRVDDIYAENQTNFWQWNNSESRLKYDKKRLDAVDVKNRDVYFFTAILVNHIVSGINAVRLARQHNKMVAQEAFKYNFVVNGIRPENRYIGLHISHTF